MLQNTISYQIEVDIYWLFSLFYKVRESVSYFITRFSGNHFIFTTVSDINTDQIRLVNMLNDFQTQFLPIHFHSVKSHKLWHPEFSLFMPFFSSIIFHNSITLINFTFVHFIHALVDLCVFLMKNNDDLWRVAKFIISYAHTMCGLVFLSFHFAIVADK